MAISEQRRRIIRNLCASQDANAACRFLNANDDLSRAASLIWREMNVEVVDGFSAGEFDGDFAAWRTAQLQKRIRIQFGYTVAEFEYFIGRRLAPTYFRHCLLSLIG